MSPQQLRDKTKFLKPMIISRAKLCDGNESQQQLYDNVGGSKEKELAERSLLPRADRGAHGQRLVASEALPFFNETNFVQ